MGGRADVRSARRWLTRPPFFKHRAVRFGGVEYSEAERGEVWRSNAKSYPNKVR